MSALAVAVRGGRPGLAAPIIYRLASRLEQVPDKEMREDPVTAAFVLRGAQNLFGLPFVVNHFESGLELDDAALGVAIDVAGRLAAELRGVAGVIGVLTGPATLGRMGSRITVNCYVMGQKSGGDPVWYHSTRPKAGFVSGSLLNTGRDPAYKVPACW